MSESDRNRLVACRACGNRVARDARRCPACGAREPSASDTVPAADRPQAQGADVPGHAPDSRRRATPPSRPKNEVSTAPKPTPAAAASPPSRPTGRRRRRTLAVTLSVLLLATAAGVAAIYLTATPVTPPVETAVVAAPTMAPSEPARSAPAPPSPSAPATPSRSRGRTDWLFFFRTGDWLTRMNDDALLGVVVRVEKSHTFPDGSSGPAYVVQSMEGEERVLDADELERTARVR